MASLFDDDLFEKGSPVDDGAHMLFFALLPDAPTIAQIMATRSPLQHRFGLRSLVDADRLHLTVCLAGRPERQRQPLRESLIEAAHAVTSEPADVVLARCLRFNGGLGESPCVLATDTGGAAGVVALRRRLAEAQAGQGLRVSGVDSFHPHVTLGYCASLADIDEPIAPIRWRAHEFVLIDSHVGKHRHEVLGRWPLSKSERGVLAAC